MEKEKILIVDDEIAHAEFAAAILKNEGYELFFSDNGKKTLKLLEKNVYDLLLLDIQMPGLSGMEVCREIRNKHISTPVIFLTGKTGTQIIAECFLIGAQDYLVKPFAAEELLARVKSQLKLKQFSDNLQGIVDERTKELKDTIETLKIEIARRIEAESLLVSKNNALQEILNYLEDEKKKANDKILKNIETLIIAPLNNLKKNIEQNCARDKLLDCVNYLTENLEKIKNPGYDSIADIKTNLSHQEYEICRLINDGLRNKEIADKLNLSEETVKWHRKKICKKLNISDTGQSLAEYLNKIMNLA